MDTAFAALRAAEVSIAAACALIGRSRATHYRRVDPLGAALGPVHGPWLSRRPPPCTITDDDRAAVLALLNSEQYRDLAIPQVWARELDEGRFWCSQSSMYRIARAGGQSRERRAQASHPPRVRPELVAHGPNQVWSWDITALKGPRKGEWYKLYVVLDIFSRYAAGWLVADAEDAVVAKDFLADAVARNGVIPHTIHADRGGSMTSKPVSELMIDLGVRRSHSRPRCSKDNPYSEGQFKTLKYMQFPRPVRIPGRCPRVL
jgi:putative transposase